MYIFIADCNKVENCNDAKVQYETKHNSHKNPLSKFDGASDSVSKLYHFATRQIGEVTILLRRNDDNSEFAVKLAVDDSAIRLLVIKHILSLRRCDEASGCPTIIGIECVQRGVFCRGLGAMPWIGRRKLEAAA